MVRVFTEFAGVGGIPTTLEGVPVEVQVTGVFKAQQVDPAARFARPVPIGVSTGHPEITAGTIGCRVLDSAGNVFALSNNHVFANGNEASVGDPDVFDDGDIVLQPGPYDGGIWPADGIGWLFDFEPIQYNGVANLMDAAIAFVFADDLQAATPGIAGVDGYGQPSSVTVEPSEGLAVQKFGRTTGWTFGTIDALNVTVTVCYQTRGPVKCVKQATFVNQIAITPGTFSAGGDSGSLIVTVEGNQPVGLLFAGSDVSTIASPIGPILERFQITIDDGSGATVARGDIEGVVESEAGVAIAGATVSLNTGQATTSDATGLYFFMDLPVGSYTVTASADGFGEDSQPADVVENTVTTVDFALAPSPTGTITGHVKDIDGAPIAAATVTLSTSQSTSTDTAGNYAFLNLPVGNYTLSASADGYESRSESVEVTADGTTVVDFSLPVKTSSSIVVPAGFEVVEANGWGGTIESVLRLQEVYAGVFAGPVTISGMAFRLDNPLGTTAKGINPAVQSAAARTNAVPSHVASQFSPGPETAAFELDNEAVNLWIRLSTTSASPDGLSPRFSANVGNDEIEVFRGWATVSAVGGAGAGVPNAFEIQIPFTSNFVYDPAHGNLLVDIINYSGTSSGARVDASSLKTDNASRAFASDPNATRALSRDSGADIIQFEVVPAAP